MKRDVTLKAQALYYQLRQLGLDHSHALADVVRIVWKQARLPEVGASATPVRIKSKRPR